MNKEGLQDWLLCNRGFLDEYNNLLIESVVSQFPNITQTNNLKKINWKYMLMCASIFAQSKKEECQDKALRISQYCIEKSSTSEMEKNAAAAILGILSNKPAINLAIKRGKLSNDYLDRLPFQLLQDTIKKEIKNTLHIFDDEFIFVNNFQREFWDIVNKNNWLSVSAPTSAGKSFIIEQWIIYYLRYSPHANIVYIVPTRALISQVTNEIKRLFKKYNFTKYIVSVLPLQTSIKENVANILIYTQERYQILLSELINNIDLLIIDEAHKMGDNYRGILLQQAIDTSISYNPTCKIIYASPMTNNPEVLLEDLPEQDTKSSLISQCITVNQNLIWVSQKAIQPLMWGVSVVNGSNKRDLGEVRLNDSPNSPNRKKALISYAISGKTSGNVIYANGAADAEKIAKILYGLFSEEDIEDNKEIDNLINLIQKIIHKSYSLSMYLKKGIAFHYGNIPLIIRDEIERLFNKGLIKYLVCTSTLIEGVNLPCRNLFLHGPQKGRNNPMNETDFWNLAGRAGRWGKEFQGNIFCIEATKKNVWKNGTPTNRTKYPIVKKTDEVIDKFEFIEYLNSIKNSLIPPINFQFEYMLSYLSTQLIHNNGFNNNHWIKKFGSEKIKFIEETVSTILGNLDVSEEVILKNPGVSPYAMDKLYKYFAKRTLQDNKPIMELLPVSPESEDAFEIYIKILHRINRYLANNIFGVGKRVNYLALLIINWMNGYSLARIISEREKYSKKENMNYNIHRIIRDTMKDVEEIARFQAPKYLSCYVDVLKSFLESQKKKSLISNLSNVHIIMEFGVSSKTQLSLIGIGLSRTSAITLSEIIPEDSLDENQVLDWLNNNKWMTEDMPQLIIAQIEMVLNTARNI